jgi:hypothetical protein
MKNKNTSSIINYSQIYRTLWLSFTGVLLFISLDFFLPVANYISLFLLFLSLIFLAIHFYTNKLYCLVASFTLCACSIIVIIAFLKFF